MLRKHLLAPLFAAALIALPGVGSVHATELHRLAEDASFFERYTNSAQDLILK